MECEGFMVVWKGATSTWCLSKFSWLCDVRVCGEV